MRKSFTTRGFSAIGRKSNFFGSSVESKYVGGGFIVTYEKRQRKNQPHLYVTVDLDGHGRIHEGFTATAITPSIETAKIHSGSAFRVHFDLMNGEPHDYAGNTIRFCRCGYDDPSRARRRDTDGLPVEPDREWTPVQVNMPTRKSGRGASKVQKVKAVMASNGGIICRDCHKEFERRGNRGRPPVRCYSCSGK